MDTEVASEQIAVALNIRVIRYDIYRIPDSILPAPLQRVFRGRGKPSPDMLHLHSYGKRRAQWKTYRYGGKVVARIAIGKKHYKGEALCSLSDAFDEFTGRTLAIKRALLQAGVAEE